jgi:hypothetical protein
MKSQDDTNFAIGTPAVPAGMMQPLNDGEVIPPHQKNALNLPRSFKEN